MRFVILAASLAVMFLGGYGARQKDSDAQSASSGEATPLILEKNEGELRVRRPREVPVPTKSFMFKVDSKNGGSQHLIFFTEEIPPGGTIPRHKHLGQDEILFIKTSTAHVWLGSQERDVHAGATVFIPSETWISLKNTGSEDLALVSIFSGLGFDDYLRCTSIPAGGQSAALSSQEWKECQHKGHAVFEAASQPALSK